MGYFSYAYVVEVSADDEGVNLHTSLYAEHLDSGKPVFFSWADGTRSPGLYSYAHGTLYSEKKLSQLAGYPRTERIGNGPGETPDLVLIEENFTPREESEPVLFHFVLPPRFVSRPDMTPFIIPSPPSVVLRNDTLTATFVARGGGAVRFWVSRLAKGVTFKDYDLDRVFNAPITKNAKVTFELNLGVIKIAIGDR